MAAYGDAGPISSYEYDHFVPLELGGAVNDPRNLWPEPGASPNPKDAVEDALNRKVCDGQMTLAQAQRAITTNWIALAVPASEPAPSGRTSASTTTPTSAGSAGERQVHCQRLLQRPLSRLRRLRPLKPAQPDGDSHRRGRAHGHLAHRREWLRRRVPSRRQ